jgi:hypothetical protein
MSQRKEPPPSGPGSPPELPGGLAVVSPLFRTLGQPRGWLKPSRPLQPAGAAQILAVAESCEKLALRQAGPESHERAAVVESAYRLCLLDAPEEPCCCWTALQAPSHEAGPQSWRYVDQSLACCQLGWVVDMSREVPGVVVTASSPPLISLAKAAQRRSRLESFS